MIPKIYFDVAGQLVSKHPVEIVKLEMRADDALADCWWQVHDFAPQLGETSAPAEGSIPIKSWPATGGNPDYKEFKSGELVLANGLYICISSTEATKTLGTGSNKFASLAVELFAEDPHPTVTAHVAATGSSFLQCWTEAEGPKKLVRVKVTNLEASIRWLMLFANDDAADSQRPLKTWELAATGDTDGKDSLDLRFGDGLSVHDNDGTAGGLRQGCMLVLSEVESILSATVGAGMDIYAESKV